MITNRDIFVTKVAEHIDENHSKHKDSYIFGISGKWGEGKTTFIESLERELKKIKKSYKIIDINPWKYSKDKTSFLRNFIIQVNDRNCRVQRFVDKNFRNLDYGKLFNDISKNKINYFGLILSFVVLTGLVVSYYFLLSDSYRQNIATYQTPILLFFIPIIIFIIERLITRQISSRQVNTIDKFDEFLNKILNIHKDERLVVYVDDLDRVTAEVAKEVLDNLRTFFDKKELTFVVTGDHSVLERYLGMEILPNKEEPAQIEEGRRFLKKIFNIYWRLPLPTNSELTNFIEDKIKTNQSVFEKIFTNSKDPDIFKKFLIKYFENNFRQIERFIELVVFCFKIVEGYSFSDKDDNKKYIQDINKNPLLLIRCLMIQELANPLFEDIMCNQNILINLENAAYKNNIGYISENINKRDDLSETQKQFMRSFLLENPKFYDTSGSLIVYDVRAFISLAADADFGDSRGMDKNDFIEIIRTNDLNKLINAIPSFGPEKIKDAIISLEELLNATEDVNVKKNYLETVLNGSLSIKGKNKIPIQLVDFFKNFNYEFLNGLPVTEKISSYEKIWKVFDSDDVDYDKVKDKFKFTSLDDFNNIKLEDCKTFGSFLSDIICDWFLQAYSQNKNNALEKMKGFVERLSDNKKIASEVVNFIDNAISENEEIRNNIFEVIIKNIDNGEDLYKTRLLDEISKLNEQVYNWVVAKINSSNLKITNNELETVLLNKIKQTDDAELIQVLKWCMPKITNLQNDFWEIIEKNKLDFLLKNLNLLNEPVFQNFSIPPVNTAELFYNKIIEYVENVIIPVTQLDYLKKRDIWNNLLKIPDERKLTGKLKSKKTEDQQRNDIIRDVLRSWGKQV